MPEYTLPTITDPDNHDWVQELVLLMACLRSEGGCPWDRQQTHQSLTRYLVEETFEFLDAVAAEDGEHMAEELGDILLQIVFHCRIAEEQCRFDLQRVARICCEKMWRRHPHVWGDCRADTPGAVVERWEEIKRREKGHQDRKSALDGIPRHLPALTHAEKLQGRAVKAGLHGEDVDGGLAAARGHLERLSEAVDAGDNGAAHGALGDLLFATVQICRAVAVEPQGALRASSGRFAERIRAAEADGRGVSPSEAPIDAVREAELTVDPATSDG